MLFGHGDDMQACGVPIVGNFSSNVWYDGYVADLHEVVVESLSSITSYPEPDARSLRQLLAEANGVQLSNVLVSNGAIEALYLIAQAWKGSRSLVVVPTFSEYEDACRVNDHELLFLNEEDFVGAIPDVADIVWICNPNNPTGRVWSRKQLLSLIELSSDKLFVVDQSYASYCTEELLRATDVLRYNNLIMVGSLTKCYAIPGIRVGYVVSAAENIAQLLQVRIPWSVNTIAIAVAKHFIANSSRYQLPLSRWMAQKEQLCSELSVIEEVEVMPSSTPFFLLRLKKGNGAMLKQYLIKEHGLLIRSAANFRGLNASYVRISPQDDATNQKLVNALKQWRP
jgi:threonine-phosphate decarboxylase